MYLDHKKTFKKTRIKLYKTLALPVLFYGSETWTIKARDARKITAAAMKYMRTAGYTWTDYKTNTVKPVLNGISRDQNIFPLKPGFRLIKVHYL
jgi:hypothetical protein